MSKVMCFCSSVLDEYFGNGFVKYTNAIPEKFTNFNSQWVERDEELENNSKYRQVIPYTVIVDRNIEKVFCVVKRKTAEKRLQGLVSFGASGHIDECDRISDNWITIGNGRRRELKEELICEIKIFKRKGLIKLDEGVSKYHLGIVFFGICWNEDCTINPEDEKGGTVATGEWVKISELQSYCKDNNLKLESWAELIYKELLKEKKK